MPRCLLITLPYFGGTSEKLLTTAAPEIPLTSECAGEKRPLMKTSWLRRDPSKVNGAIAFRVNSGSPRSKTCRNGDFKIGATFVYFHSSVRAVGKSSESKLEAPFSRSVTSHAGSRPSRVLAKSLYAEK